MSLASKRVKNVEINSGDNKKKKLLLVIIFLLILLLFLWFLKFLFSKPEPEWDDDLSQDAMNTITYEGKQYSYNHNLMNILFLGIDNTDMLVGNEIPGEAGQSDCIMLLTLDKSKKEAKIMQIPRDTMTEVDIYDVAGNYNTTVTEQIATQYAYSIGGKSSCLATVKTVSELLYELPIDGYLAMDYSSIAPVNDAIGGVALTIPKDYTQILPEFKEGTTLKLNGQQAHKYVRWRDTNASFSNNDRMERQVQYIPAMIDTIRKNMDSNENYFKVLYPLVEKYMVTDLTEDQVNELVDYNLVTSDIRFLPGEGKKGEKYEEFYVNDEKLKKMLIETFYILEK